MIVRQLVAYRHGERWDMLMENFADRHRIPDAQAIADVAAYVSQLNEPAPPGLGSGELVGRGALLAQLDHDDIAGVADYLSRIAPHYAAPITHLY